MEPGRATPRKDRWKMQVKATRDRRCRIRVAPSSRPGRGFIPRAEPTFFDSRAEPSSDLNATASGAAPSPGEPAKHG